MIVLVTGAHGQVGHALVREAKHRSVPCIALGRNQLDVTAPAAVEAALGGIAFTPDVVINLAAWTHVDAAESEPDAAFRVNALGVDTLAHACARAGTPLLHVSTDYVFDGTADRPYRESDPVRPINAYGGTKAAGEEALRARLDEHLIVRTSWIFGVHGWNFVRSMLRAAGTRDDVRVVDDEVGCPTGAAALAATLLTLAERVTTAGFGDWGTYHYCGTPAVSRAEYARAIYDIAARIDGLPSARVIDIPSSAYPLPATRPRRVVLDCTKIRRVFGIEQPEWRPCLDRMLRDMARDGAA